MSSSKARQLPTWHIWPRVVVAIMSMAGLAHSCTAAVSASSASAGAELKLTLPPPTWRTASLCLAFLWAVGSILLRPVELRSMQSHDNKDARYRAKRRAAFPPPYPNGWFRVCSAADIARGRVHSVSALGTELVCFRDGEGHAAVLYAFCPHMGAHLGQGGVVNDDGCLQCPFHEWAFNREGKVTSIPYCTSKTVPERARTQAFVTREFLGMVFIWFDAEGRAPMWELEQHTELERAVGSGAFYYGGMRQMVFEQHVCEMHMNSADAYHFNSLHAPLPVPGLGWLIKCTHKVATRYHHPKAHLNTFIEKMMALHFDLSFLGLRGWRIGVPFAKSTAATVNTCVTFEGPAIMHFEIKTPLGTMRQVKTVLPVAPFTMHVEARWFASRSVPRVLLWLMSVVGASALDQDRQVWENKTYHKKPMLVAGDGCFPAFMRWYGQFYSSSSQSLDAGLQTASLEVGSAATAQAKPLIGEASDVCTHDSCAGLNNSCTSDGHTRAHVIRRGAANTAGRGALDW